MKRDARLHGLSTDHHHALVLARRVAAQAPGWTVADGAALSDAFDRELAPHFAVEEEVLLPALRAAGEALLDDRTRADHDELRELVAAAMQGDGEAAAAFAARLTLHVRFEERELFEACEARLAGAVLDEAARRAPKR